MRWLVVSVCRMQSCRDTKSGFIQTANHCFQSGCFFLLVACDESKVDYESRLTESGFATNTDLSVDRAALKCKELWRMEKVFWDIKSLLDTRPIFPKRKAVEFGGSSF